MAGALWFPLMVAAFVGLAAGQDGDWWQRTVFYQIYPRSFMDSDGDGVGDLRGIRNRLWHLRDAGIGATWLSPIFLSPMVDFGYDITDYTAIQPEYGTMEDFESLMDEARRLGVKIILDFVPNHTSDQCEWFRRSVAREPPYSEYYVWHDGREDANGTRLPPNNWQSVFYGSAWTYHPERGQYYLHQFTAQQPDLNFRQPAVVEEMKEVLRFWLRKGVAGFRIDAVNHLFEVEDFRDEPETGTDRDPLSYGYTHHIYTKDLLEDYDMVYQWRALLDDWSRQYGGDSRIIMTEAYANITFTMRYYHEGEDGHGQSVRRGSHMPFNFLLITDLERGSSAQDFVFTINKWLTYMPRDATANWVLGNHDQPRVATRYGAERIDAIHTLLMTLPGIAVTYYGEEIGMEDYRDAIGGTPQDNGEAFIVFSRDPERTPFQWDDTANGGFSIGPSTWLPVNPNYRTLNLAAQKRAERSHYRTYQGLVRLRQHETFRRGSIQLVPYSSSIVTYVRELHGSDTFVIVINLSGESSTVDLASVYSRLAPQLTVASSGSTSSYRSGDIVQSDRLPVDGYDGLVLCSVPVTASHGQDGASGKRTASEVLWSAAKDAAVIASIIIALGTSYYHFQYCPPSSSSWAGGKWPGPKK
ncbi:maltase 2-like [Anopheles bellator]|uniref:maltase 2-like n=1 Tax=Anopheles bellator TaxID=139047 RepID=UPI002649213A|nr:maltase 2-like [Anopheles bellator]